MKRPLLLGHRGVRGRKYGVRENTMRAFDLALRHGCDGFEFDVRVTADQCAVVCHDARFARVTVAKAPAEELRLLPLLEDVLAAYGGRAFLDIELKVPGVASCLCSALARNRPPRDYVVSSFLPEVLAELKAQDSSIPLGLICERRAQLGGYRGLPIQYVIAEHSLISEELVAEVHRAGKKLFAWTVNAPETMLRLAQWEADGIISDKPDLLVRTVAELVAR
jgi:glycerophosphoryl diester phosphodiesterase